MTAARGGLHAGPADGGRRTAGGSADSPVAVDVTGTEGEAAVDQHGVDHGALLAVRQQVTQVGQVAEAGADAVAGTVLVHNEHLARTQPALRRHSRAYSQPCGKPAE